MALTVLNKALIGAVVTTTLSGGLAYGSYSLIANSETVKDALTKKQKNPLNLDQKTQEDIDALKELAKQYHSSTYSGKKKIKEFELSSAGAFQELESKCKELLNTKSNHKDFNTNLEDATNWCSKDTAPVLVKNLLKSKNRQLLGEGDETTWNESWKRFKEKYNGKTLGSKLIIGDLTGTEQTDSTAPKAFKDRCTANGERSLTPDQISTFLDEIIDYCTKSITNVPAT